MRVCMHSRADAMQPQVVGSDVYVVIVDVIISFRRLRPLTHTRAPTPTPTPIPTPRAHTHSHTHTQAQRRAHIACIDSCCGARCIGRQRRPCTNRCKIIVLRNAQKHIVVSQPYVVFGEMFEKSKILYTPSTHPTTPRRLSRARNEETGTHSSTTKRRSSRTDLRVVLYCY